MAGWRGFGDSFEPATIFRREDLSGADSGYYGIDQFGHQLAGAKSAITVGPQQNICFGQPSTICTELSLTHSRFGNGSTIPYVYFDLSDEDTEGDALQRAAANFGTIIAHERSTIREARTEYRFIERKVFYCCFAHGLMIGRNYTITLPLSRRARDGPREPDFFGDIGDWQDVDPIIIGPFAATAVDMVLGGAGTPNAPDPGTLLIKAVGWEYLLGDPQIELSE
jgi:hypothetical protein